MTNTPFLCSHASHCTITAWKCPHKEQHDFNEACTKRVPDNIDCKGICEPIPIKQIKKPVFEKTVRESNIGAYKRRRRDA